MNAKAALLRQQLNWASRAGLRPDSRGYLDHYELNLFQRLSHLAKAAFADGSGSELLPSENRPAKMAALHSSSALAVNAFDYWSDKPLGIIADALQIKPDPAIVRFEEKFPTGLGGTPPNLDLAFYYSDDHIAGIESKFTEAHFKAKYFPADSALWSQVGLPNAQCLAAALYRQEHVFRYLDAPQLLKHMLGLATAARGKSSLCYVFFDSSGRESSIHRQEIEAFANRIGSDISFNWCTYQEVFLRLRSLLGAEHHSYISYLTDRYR
jgi:hypothetical protein